MSTPAQILTVLAAVAVAAAATWRVLRRRTDARQRAAPLTAAHAARRDPLTGSGSRFAFHETMATAISQRRRAAVVLVNLDGSRPFVSRFGDRALDQLLVLIAGRVQHLVAGAGGSSFRLRRDELAASSTVRSATPPFWPPSSSRRWPSQPRSTSLDTRSPSRSAPGPASPPSP
jgi:predicted signal transduction protein with EAL and GGDEF domain